MCTLVYGQVEIATTLWAKFSALVKPTPFGENLQCVGFIGLLLLIGSSDMTNGRLSKIQVKANVLTVGDSQFGL